MSIKFYTGDEFRARKAFQTIMIAGGYGAINYNEIKFMIVIAVIRNIPQTMQDFLSEHNIAFSHFPTYMGFHFIAINNEDDFAFTKLTWI
jgi:hypothetical protein